MQLTSVNQLSLANSFSVTHYSFCFCTIFREAEREKPVFSKAKHKQSFISTAALILT